MGISTALVALGGAAISSSGAKSAANAQKDAANNATATQLQMYNQTRSDQTPWRTAGGQAVDALSQFYGLGGVQQPAQTAAGYGGLGAYGGYYGSLGGAAAQIGNSANTAAAQPYDFQKILQNQPGYQFQFDQGQKAVQQNLAARGLLQSGAAGKALTQYGQGVASDYTQKYVGGLQSLAGLGQSSTQATGAAGANAANQIGSNQIYAGNAQASGYANQANAWNSGLQGITSALAGRTGTPYQVPQDIQQGINTPIYGTGTGFNWINASP